MDLKSSFVMDPLEAAMSSQPTSKEKSINLPARSGDELKLTRDEGGDLYVCITDEDRDTSMYLEPVYAAMARDFLNAAYPAHEPFVCPVCKADPCLTVWHDQACDYAPTDDGVAHVGGKGCIPKITRPSPPPGTALQALAKFGAAVIEEARGELGDLDGGWLQDKAVECGVLEPVTALAPCGDECRCAEYDDFPQECFQYPDDVRSALTKISEQP
jgi:hypothetical protein